MVVCAIEGIAFGGGLELTLCCDYRIAAEGALFASPEVTLGISTIGCGPYRLPRLIGNAQAKRLLLSGAQPGSAASRAPPDVLTFGTVFDTLKLVAHLVN